MTNPKLQLQTNFVAPGNANKLIYDDPVMSVGSLVCWKPNQSQSIASWGAGVPADAAVLYNIAWKQAKAMVGSGDATTLGMLFKKTTLGAASALAERSGKGGLHLIVSQGSHIQGQGVAVRMADLIKTYIIANPTHSFYFSIWARDTRRDITSSAVADRWASIHDSANQGGNYLAQIWELSSGGGTYPSLTTGSAKLLGANRNTPWLDDAAGAKMLNVGTSGWNAGPPPVAAANLYASWMIGSVLSDDASTDIQKRGSRILYKGYFEDLTVSGRTYAQVDAVDYAAYSAAVLTPGGEFYGDTFTNPTTLP